MLSSLKTPHGKLEFPAFFPDATRGYIKGLTSSDLKKCKTQGLVVNTYHLIKENLVGKIKMAGGIHKYTKFSKPIISDSGGFQVMSLIHKSPDLGKIEENKITFFLDKKKVILTPENCIQTQIKLGSDIIMCLDDCTRPEANSKEQEISVARTIRWAERCKKEFVKLTKNKKQRPLLFAIIQGGENKELRKKCAQGLLEIGFDGYAFGGWPVKEGILLREILAYTSSLLPNDKPKYAMGIGKPQDIVECFKLGYNMFDCVIPTRDARHKRLYIFKNAPNKNNLKDSLSVLYIRGKYASIKSPISEFCDADCCKNHSLSDLVHFFRQKDKQAIRFASMHNLRHYSMLTTILKNINT